MNDKDKSIIIRTSPYAKDTLKSKVHIYDKNLTFIQSLADSVISVNNEKISIEFNSFGRIEIPDINNDSKKEIFAACSKEKDTSYFHKGIYMWSMEENGKYCGKRIYTNDSVQFCSDIVIGDVDGDFQKEIIFAAKMNRDTTFTFNILKKDINGNYYCSFSQYIPYNLNSEFKVLPLSLGDITGDNIPEVVFVVTYEYSKFVDGNEQKSNINYVYTYNIDDGLKCLGKDLKVRTDVSPLIVDVNGDNIAEIIIQSEGKEGYPGMIYAYNYNGSSVKGFPINLRTNFTGSIAAGDIDGDGKTELVGGSYRNIYAWDTEGEVSMIEWGMAHGNYPSTGEYINDKKYITLKSDTTIVSSILRIPMVIPSGLTYVVAGDLTSISDCGKQANSITILDGGTLVIDRGETSNITIKLCSGGRFTINERGCVRNSFIELCPGGEMFVNTDAIKESSVKVSSNAKLNIVNNGIISDSYIDISSDGLLNINKGSIIDTFVDVKDKGVLKIINGGSINNAVEGFPKLNISKGAIFNLINGTNK